MNETSHEFILEKELEEVIDKEKEKVKELKYLQASHLTLYLLFAILYLTLKGSRKRK